jgi:hypothetical protein
LGVGSSVTISASPAKAKARNALGYRVWHPDYGYVESDAVVELVGALPFGFVLVDEVDDTNAAPTIGDSAATERF